LSALSRWTVPKLGDGGIRALAGQHGYSAERALMRGCWRLVDHEGNRIKNR
jgi:hypothetical protein